MHGILDNPAVLDNLAEGFDTETTTGPFDYAAFKEEQYDKLAALVREHVDMEYIYNSIKTNIMNRRTFMQKPDLSCPDLLYRRLSVNRIPPYTDKPPLATK